MDYGWETSEDEGGMEIDLDAQQEEQRELSLGRSGAVKGGMTENGRMRPLLTDDYDPSEPTDDYDPSEPTKDYGAEASSRDQHINTHDKDDGCNVSHDQNYDPAEPTVSDEEEEDPDMSPKDQYNLSAGTKQSEDSDEENDGRWDSQMVLTQDETAPSPCEEKVYDSPVKSCEHVGKIKGQRSDDSLNQTGGQSQLNKSKSGSPLLEPIDTDENTNQNSLLDDIELPDVAFDEADFVLEKEPFQKVQPNSTSSPRSDRGKSDRKETGFRLSEDNRNQDPEDSDSPNSDLRHSYSQDDDRERFRRQEEVDTRNEEALVDLFREESDADRIEADIAQPVKKTKKKLVSKKVKKKGKKLKKDQGKKSHSKQLSETAEDQRFVEISRERLSTEMREEGELEVDVARSKSYDERVALDIYEQTFDIGTGNQPEDEQREPGEIVEEGKKRWKKRDKKERKKKKNRREVATVEEGNQGDDDSQKFPSFLAGFFVQDEGGEELEENLENLSRSYENEEERTFQKGGKTYRKRHSSEAEDSVKSFDQNVNETQETREQESDHRKSRKHDERGHESRDRRQHEVRDVREVRGRDKEHRHGTPRDRERDRDRERERSRSEREKERVRTRDRDREREREREREVVWDRERDRSRRVEIEERRGHRARSGSRDHRRWSGAAERVRRSRSRERLARHRHQRSKSRERSLDRERERERERERLKRRHREKSRDRESERRVRRASHNRSQSPHHRSERAGSNKENREESHRRRRQVRTHEDSDSEDREGRRRRHRRERREPERSSSTSSSSVEDSGTRHRNSGHHHHFSNHHSSDEGASSDVILVEPERIVINLDEEEDPPSRVDITHANAEDDSTKLVDGESIPPPPELSRNSRSSALIQINPAEPEIEEPDEPEGDATPTRDEPSDEAQLRWHNKVVQESDYDPAHPTEEAEEQESRSSTLNTDRSSALPTSKLGPVPPDHPPPEEVRPAPPPGPSKVDANKTVSAITHSQQSPMPGGPRPQLLISFQRQPAPQLQTLQQQPTLLPFPGGALIGPGQAQRFPTWPIANGPNSNMLPPNTGPPTTFPPSQRGLLPTPDTRQIFPAENSRLPLQFGSSLPHLSHPPPLREGLPQQINTVRPPMPLSAMAPLAQLTSLLPALERAKMAAHRDEHSMPQPSEMFKHSLSSVSVQSSIMGKGPLLSSSAANMSLGLVRPTRSLGDLSESIEVVDMDMSPGEDDCELELPSPDSSDSDRDDRKRRGRRSDTRITRAKLSVDNGKSEKGLIQPAMYLKALSKAIEKLTPKPQTTTAGPTASLQDKSKSQPGKKKKKMESNEDDLPASAVDLTNKEKFLKKLHLQERVIDEVKLAIKPFYSSKKITKEQYKLILRKAVPKVCHSKSGNINPQKIQQLVEAYVGKLKKGKEPGSGKKKKHHPAKEAQTSKETASTSVRQNGEWSKKPTR